MKEDYSSKKFVSELPGFDFRNIDEVDINLAERWLNTLRKPSEHDSWVPVKAEFMPSSRETEPTATTQYQSAIYLYSRCSVTGKHMLEVFHPDYTEDINWKLSHWTEVEATANEVS